MRANLQKNHYKVCFPPAYYLTTLFVTYDGFYLE